VSDKVMTAAQAAGMIRSGMHVGVGAGMDMNPMPVIRQVIKNGVKDLTLTSVLTGGYVADLLIGAGCVSTVQFPQIVMDEFGLAPCFMRAAKQGDLKMIESICPALLLGLQAGASGIPFTPVIGFLNSDYMKIRPDVKTMKDPYTGNDYAVIQAIIPDVAVIHAFRGDRTGAVVTDSFRNDRLLATAARKTIAVVEELVEPDEVLAGRHGVYVSAFHVDAVVVAPRGAHPTACRGRYEIDRAHMTEYMQAAKEESLFKSYVEKYIIKPKDHDEYLSLIGSRGAK
jgi:glutaconate CoA-transferase, subunit A